MRQIISVTTEDYLRAIYTLHAAKTGVSTQAFANRLGVAAPSATAMVKKLASLQLLFHTPYRGVDLTEEGEQIALRMIRRHRLAKTYLFEVLGVAWDRVAVEADGWEHVLSEEVEANMAAALNYPARDPHGHPIPTGDGQIAQETCERLSAAPTGRRMAVRRVNDEDAEMLRHLREVGLVPGATVEVLWAVAAEGVLQLRVEGKRKTVALAPAAAVFVTLCDQAPDQAEHTLAIAPKSRLKAAASSVLPGHDAQDRTKIHSQKS